MRKPRDIRFVNGILALAAIVLFALHGVLGAISGFVDIPRSFAWLVWVGVGLIAVHVIGSIATSRQQLGDKERPPSLRKKRHLALKWVTGGALVVAAAIHIVHMRTSGGSLQDVLDTPLGLVSMLALIALLAWHICVGVKSLLKDIGASRRRMNAVRALVVVAAAAIGVACLVVALG